MAEIYSQSIGGRWGSYDPAASKGAFSSGNSYYGQTYGGYPVETLRQMEAQNARINSARAARGLPPLEDNGAYPRLPGYQNPQPSQQPANNSAIRQPIQQSTSLSTGVAPGTTPPSQPSSTGTKATPGYSLVGDVLYKDGVAGTRNANGAWSFDKPAEATQPAATPEPSATTPVSAETTSSTQPAADAAAAPTPEYDSAEDILKRHGLSSN